MNFVYYFTNKDNEVVYVGRTSDIHRRLMEHFKSGHLDESVYLEVSGVYVAEVKTVNESRFYELYFIANWRPRYNTTHVNDGNIKGVELKLGFVDYKVYRKNNPSPEDISKQINQEKAEFQRKLDSITNLGMTSEELRDRFKSHFTRDVYNMIKKGEDFLGMKWFQVNVHADQYAATLKNSNITDYETCKKLGEAVRNRAQINVYSNDIQALVDIASLEYVKRVTDYKRVYIEIMKLKDKVYLSSDFKKVTEKILPKKLKVTKSDVKMGLKLFHVLRGRNGSDRLTTIKPLTVALLTEKHMVKTEKIKQSVTMQVMAESKQRQRILIPAIVNFHGFTPIVEAESNERIA